MHDLIDPATVAATELHRHLGVRPIFDDMGGLLGVAASVWNPRAKQVTIHYSETDRSFRLTKQASGYHVGFDHDGRIGDAYSVVIDENPPRPDPVSRFQVDSVHGPSRVIDTRFDWRHDDVARPPLTDWVIYEAHVGGLTNDGTYAAAERRLPELKSLGIDAIEWMPLADCAGRWNWGYDGVHLFAPNRNYGRPEELRGFVDQAHRLGIAVIIDVVYNHLGPEGNYLGELGPYLSKRHHTVWGSAPAFDNERFGDAVRRFFIANAVYWFDEFHVDALRVDAIHCIEDDRRPHVMHELADVIEDYAARSGRRCELIAETNVYDPLMVSSSVSPSTTSTADESTVGFDGQWSDDFVHSIYAAVQPGPKLSHRDYRPDADLRQVLSIGRIYEGSFDDSRGRIDETSEALPPTQVHRLVRCIQNHDFIGNHPMGNRIAESTSRTTQMAMAAALMMQPGIPMLFMGEEFASPKPFAFFVDFADPRLRQGVVEGRRREYPQHDWSGGKSPLDESTFFQSKLGEIKDRAMWDWYRELIRLRRTMRADGLLDAANMTLADASTEGLFQWGYRADTGQVGVDIGLACRPAPPSTRPPRDAPMRPTIPEGQIIASSIQKRFAETDSPGPSKKASRDPIANDSWAVIWTDSPSLAKRLMVP